MLFVLTKKTSDHIISSLSSLFKIFLLFPFKACVCANPYVIMYLCLKNANYFTLNILLSIWSKLVAGAYEIYNLSSAAVQERKISKVYSYDQTPTAIIVHDLAILKANLPFLLNHFIGVIGLPDAGFQPQG